MKKIILSLVLVGMIGFMGCEKEPIPSPNPTVNLLVDEEPNAVVDSMGTVIFDNPMLSDVTESTDVTIMDYPLFLDYDPFTMIVSRGKGDVDSCVKGIEVTKAEKELLNKAHLAKLECEKTNKEILYKLHREIESWAKTEKATMYKKYLATRDSLYRDFQMKVAYVNDKYDKGLITADQKKKSLTELETKYKNDIAALEKSYANGLNLLNGKVKEKIKTNSDRTTTSGKIKDCEKEYLNKVLDILGKTRYKKWMECHKYNYKKK
jgi:hypothetical protein